MKNPAHLPLLLSLLLGFGCASEGPYVPAQRQLSPELENPTVILDEEISNLIAVDTQTSEKNVHGKLKIMSNIRNRSNRDVTLQIQTVFRDAGGFSIDDDTAWETIVLTANETRTISSTSTSKKAERYTVRIRMMR